jgi:topoisomerase IA-like protein
VGEASFVEASRLLHPGPEPGRNLLTRYGKHGPIVHLPNEQMNGIGTNVHNRMPAHTISRD